MQLKLWDARVSVFSKCVVEFHSYAVKCFASAKDLHVRRLELIECPDIVEARDMVAVGMCDQDGVDACYPFSEHLLSEVRTSVDDDGLAVGLKVNGRPEALIAKVEGTAYFAFAPDHGHPL